jgi:dihydrofolate synthase/folylpolyglutamate synthase
MEKAGIIKNETPVIIGETVPETKAVFDLISSEKNAPVIYCENSTPDNRFKCPLLGEYQEKNLRTVLTAISELNKKGFNISAEDIQNGLNNLSRNTGFFGRMQVISKEPLTILDVSHNEDGIRKTLKSIIELNRGKLHIIYGSSSDKDYRKIIRSLPIEASLSLCRFSSQRSLSRTQLEELAAGIPSHPKVYENIKEAIHSVQSTANKSDTILVFGSFFLISDFF